LSKVVSGFCNAGVALVARACAVRSGFAFCRDRSSTLARRIISVSFSDCVSTRVKPSEMVLYW
jgi:hypothetical protein